MSIYTISRHWRRAVIWHAGKNHRRVMTSTCTPKPGLTAKDRHKRLCEFLAGFGIKQLPEFK